MSRWATAPSSFAALTKQLADAVYLTARYDVPDERGETRRQRNARFGEESPDVEVPEEGEHVWDWFWELCPRRRSGPEPLTFADVGEWQRLLMYDLLREEVEMLMAMDDRYLTAVREDQAAARARALEANKGNR